ncbi:MAG TPA: DUF4062 domain-containing protein [Candidatus Angelobacter sp.]|nr:DUF4062 domain-containing protein [Candidatus Angelobacter sp.]
MVDFIKKRLQVFVSSTYSDLREERQAAVEAILSAGHIPAGMELFAAGDESQMEVIQQWIDESDVYLLILAGRYGSIEPRSGKSYTQLEYEYALSKEKPLFACVLNEDALNTRVQKHGMAMLDEHGKELHVFRDLVKSKMVEFWDDSKDIKLAIVKKLGQLERRQDLMGWVRPHQEANLPALSNEIVRLSKENAELRSELTSKSEAHIMGLSYSQWKTHLQKKNLWGYIKDNSQELRAGVGMHTDPEIINELINLRLLTLHILNETCDLSEAGLVLVNNIEFEKSTSS